MERFTCAPLAILALGLVNLNCSDNNEDPPTFADAAVLVDTGPADAGVRDLGPIVIPDSGVVDMGFIDVGFPDSGPPVMDNNDSIATAFPITKTNDQPLGIRAVINPAGDRDFYSIDLTAGDWILVTANGGETTDPVLRLYGPDETQIAENDDALPRVNVNPEIIYHVGATGTYYVEVLEFSDWEADDELEPEGGRQFTYTLRVDDLDPNDDDVNIDTEAGDTEADAQTLGAGATVVIAGTLNDATDVDVYRFTSAAGMSRQIEALILPPGPTGYGGTSAAVRMARTSTAGAPVVVASVPDSENYREVAPNLPDGDYLLYVSQPLTPVTENPHYVIKLRFFAGDNPPETEPNNDLASAEVLTLVGEDPRAVFILGTLPDGDVDYYAFDVPAVETLGFVCGAEGSGSAIRGFALEIRDGNDTLLGTVATETPPDLAFAEADIPAVGRYYARISATMPLDPNGGIPFYRCGFRSAP